MIILKYIYLKFSVSFIISVLACIFIFFVFSLLANLGEGLSFFNILKLSIINSIQTLIYIPLIIFLISFSLFVIFLRSNNELIIVREYLSSFLMVLYTLPILISFSFIEINKFEISKKLENVKSNLSDKKNDDGSKLIITKGKNSKKYLMINGITEDSNSLNEYYSFNIKENIIHSAEFTKNVRVEENKLIAKDLINYQKKEFKLKKSEKVILSDYKEFLSNNRKKINITEYMKIYPSIINYIKFVFFLFLNLCIFVILTNKLSTNKKNNILPSIILSSFLIIYSLLIDNFKINNYQYEVIILGVLFLVILFFKKIRYE